MWLPKIADEPTLRSSTNMSHALSIDSPPPCINPLSRELRSAPLAQLCDTLDALFEACSPFADASASRLFAHGLRDALARSAASAGLLAPAHFAGSPGHYQRHLLAADPRGRYAIAALVWMPGQQSPVHAHHTWCGYAVLEGMLSETLFEWDDARQHASTVRTHDRPMGAVSFARGGRDGNGGIHQLGNRSAARAVSLHVYGVAGERIATHVNDVVPAADSAAVPTAAA